MPDQSHWIADIRSLHISFSTAEGEKKIADDWKLSIRQGEIVGIYGDSGSGKSMCTLAMMGLVPVDAEVKLDMHYRFGGKEFRLRNADQDEWMVIRRRHIAYVFQQAPAYLNPVLRCSSQIRECLSAEKASGEGGMRAAILNVLEEVGLEEPERVFKAYPHEFSIGQQQRILLAMALLRKPSVIIADEPFANVDKETEHRLRELILRLRQREGIAFLIVSHDLGFLRDIADRQFEMKAGRLAERSFSESTYEDLAASRMPEEKGDTVLEASGIGRSYRAGGRFSLRGRRRAVVRDISVIAREGERIGIMGRSGCGKTTLARVLAGLDSADQGEIKVGGHTLRYRGPNGWKGRQRSAVQLVFQDPFTSMDPTKTIDAQVREAARYRPQEAGPFDLADAFRRFLLEPGLAALHPGQLSGGQLQRICLIRALSVYPQVLICDESFSALDRQSKRIIVEELGQNRGFRTLIVISHDPEIIRSLCNKVLIMKDGMILEEGKFEDLLEKAGHQETKMLLGKF